MTLVCEIGSHQSVWELSVEAAAGLWDEPTEKVLHWLYLGIMASFLRISANF